MTPSRLREEASRSIVEAQLLLESDPEKAAEHLLHAWSIATCLAHPSKPDDSVARLLAGEGD